GGERIEGKVEEDALLVAERPAEPLHRLHGRDPARAATDGIGGLLGEPSALLLVQLVGEVEGELDPASPPVEKGTHTESERTGARGHHQGGADGERGDEVGERRAPDRSPRGRNRDAQGADPATSSATRPPSLRPRRCLRSEERRVGKECRCRRPPYR